MTVVTPTDRPKSVRNFFVIEVFGGIFELSFGFRVFCLYMVFFLSGRSQIVFFFSLYQPKNLKNEKLQHILVNTT